MNAIDPTTLAGRLDALDRKLDLVLEEAAAVHRIRREFDELKADLAHIGKDMLRTATSELEDVALHVDTDDIVALLKRLVRNTNNLNALLGQVESARELLDDAAPVARSLVRDGVDKLDELDRKGYFAMGREVMRAVDNVVTHFSPEDARKLADNIVVMMETFKSLTQPEMLLAVNNAMEIYRKLDFAQMEEVSLWRAFRELNKPEMRRAFGFLLSFLRNLAEHPVPRGTSSTSPASIHP